MALLHQSSLRRKLILVIMLTVGLALVMAVGTFLGIEIAGYRTAAQRELRLLAEVVGEGSAAALEFNVPSDADRLLATLRVHKRIVNAAILDRKGRPFAAYRRDPGAAAPSPEALPASASAFENGHLWITAPIQHAGETLGTVYLRSDTADLRSRLAWVLGLGVVAGLLIGSLALLLAIRMGRLLSEPILHLTEAAQGIAAAGQDPGVRVRRETGDEVGVLVDAFNHMLDQLSERQARLEEAQHLARLGNWAFDPHRMHSEWSVQTFRVFGLDPAAGVPDNSTFRALVHPDDLAAMDAAMSRGLGEEGRFDLDHRILRPDGTVGWIHASGLRFLDEEGRPVLRGTIMDITDRKQAEAALLQGQKLESLGVLTGGIAHDFNNLLAALQGFLEMAKLDLPPQSLSVSHLNKAERVIQRASDLIRQMLAYSGKTSFQVVPLDLSHLVKEMGHLLSVSISKKATLQYDVEDGLPAVVGDPSQLQQVVMNLVINASDALESREGQIRISTRLERLDAEILAKAYAGQAIAPGLYVALEVEDTGHGMDAATMARIFDPFFTTKFTGRGLGLAAMLGIVRGHRGGIKVESEVQRGTTFTVLFPASSEPAPNLADRLGPEDYEGYGRVLVVDDEPDLLASATGMLQWMGFEVHQAANGAEALDRLNQDPEGYRLVILDFTMPHMDGEACFSAMRKASPSLKVLLTSGFSEGEVAGRLLQAGLAGFLQKPYSLSQLRSKLRSILG